MQKCMVVLILHIYSGVYNVKIFGPIRQGHAQYEAGNKALGYLQKTKSCMFNCVRNLYKFKLWDIWKQTVQESTYVFKLRDVAITWKSSKHTSSTSFIYIQAQDVMKTFVQVMAQRGS